jgi:hypothetical protein
MANLGNSQKSSLNLFPINKYPEKKLPMVLSVHPRKFWYQYL